MSYITSGDKRVALGTSVDYSQTAGGLTSGGQKVKTGALGLLGKVGDFLSRGNYATASAVKAGLEKKGIGEVLSSAWSGLKGQQKTTYSDVLDKMGWKAGSGGMTNKIARGLVSFTGDVLLDPTTYLTAGLGSGAKIVGKSGVTTLTKKGTKELAEGVATRIAMGESRVVARKTAERSFEKMLSESPETALKYIDRGGIKIAGKTIAGTTGLNSVVNPINKGITKAMTPIDKVVSRVVGEPLQKVLSSITGSKKIKEVTDKIGRMFSRDYASRNKPLLRRVVQEGRDLSAGLIRQMDETITKKLAKFTSVEKINVGKALWGKDTGSLTARELQLNDLIQEDFARYFAEEKARGLTKGEILGDYLNQMYENPDVLQKAMKDPRFAKENVLKVDPFTKKRTIKSLEQATKLGLKPVFDVEKLLKARASHSIRTVTDHDMLAKVLEMEGVASKIPSTTTVPIKTKEKIDKSYFEVNPKTKTLALPEKTTSKDVVMLGTGKPGRKMSEKKYLERSLALAEKRASLAGQAKRITKIETITHEGTALKTKMVRNKALNGRDMVKATSVPGLKNIRGAENIHISNETAEYLKTLANPKLDLTTPSGRFIKKYDEYTNLFKRHVLSVFPAYQSRNFRGNFFQSILEYGIVDTFNPKFHGQAMLAMSGKLAKETISIGGSKYTVGELRKIMQDNGVLQGKGFFDFTNPMKEGDKGLLKAGQTLASNIENEARATTFLIGLEQSGGDIATAAERMKKTLFDYDSLSHFERDVIRRIFPFYTWNSRAIKLVLENTLKKPGNTAKIFKIFDNMQKNSFTGISAEEKATLPEYLQNQFVFKVTGKDGVVRYKSGIGTPIESIVDLFADPVGNLSFSLNPAIKAFVTGITRYDFDNGRPVSEVTTKNAQIFKSMPKVIQNMVGYSAVQKKDGTTLHTANPFMLYVLRQPPFSRYVSSAGIATNEGRNIQAKAMQLIFGINATERDMERQIKEYENKYKDDLTASLRQKGIIKKNEYNVYYIPGDIVLDPQERAAAEEVLKATKNVKYVPEVSEPLRAFPLSKKQVKPSGKKEIKVLPSREEATKKKQSEKLRKGAKAIRVRSIAEKITR